MNRDISCKLLLLLLLTFIPVFGVFGQEMPEPPPAAGGKPLDFRTTALRQLGLSRDQLQRIRALNQERKPLMDAAQMRLRQANRSLDETIYADDASDVDFQSRLKDFQLAQADLAKIRFMNELSVRRILTPQQLMRFRRLRQSFDQSRMGGGRPTNVSVPPVEPRPMQNLVRRNLQNRQF